MKRLTGNFNLPHLSFIFTFPLQYLFLLHSQGLEFMIPSLFSILTCIDRNISYHWYCHLQKSQPPHLRDSRLHSSQETEIDFRWEMCEGNWVSVMGVDKVLSKFQDDNNRKLGVPILKASQQKQISENCGRNLLNVKAELTMPTFLKFHLAGLTQCTQWNTIQVFLGLTENVRCTRLKFRPGVQGVHIDSTGDWVNKPCLQQQKSRMQIEIQFKSPVTGSTTAINHKVVCSAFHALSMLFAQPPPHHFVCHPKSVITLLPTVVCQLPFISQVFLSLNNRTWRSSAVPYFYKFIKRDRVTVTTM